jgi:hypothetical protein
MAVFLSIATAAIAVAGADQSLSNRPLIARVLFTLSWVVATFAVALLAHPWA